MKLLFCLIMAFSFRTYADEFEDVLGQIQGTFTLGSWQSKIETQMKNEAKVPAQTPKKPSHGWDWKRFFTSLKPKAKTSSLPASELNNFVPSRVYLSIEEEKSYPAAVVVKSRPSGLSQFHFIVNDKLSVEQPVMEKGSGEIFVVIDNVPFEAFLCPGDSKDQTELVFVSRRLDKQHINRLKNCILYKQKSMFPKSCD